jgi:hypothetical protein
MYRREALVGSTRQLPEPIMNAILPWMRANAIALASVEAGQGLADLIRLGPLIGDARIVSLGEATHGTREIFQLKHRLLEYLVAERRPIWSRPELAASPSNMQLAGDGELPDFWTSSGNWRMHGHEVGAFAHALARRRPHAAHFAPRRPWRWGEGWLAQAFAAAPWRGKRLRWSGAVRTEVCEAAAGAQLYVEVRPEPPAGAIWIPPASHVAMIAHPVRSLQWETYQVEVDVPERRIRSASAARWRGMGRHGLAILRWLRANSPRLGA